MEPPVTNALQNRIDQAHALILQMASEGLPADADADARLRNIKQSLSAWGTYSQTFDELQYSARVAWRNSSRCIGRLLWRTLKVVDARTASTAEQIFDACVEHLRQSTNGGKIRPMITVFAPADESGTGPRIWNDQLIRYAGYRQSDGSILGDPEQLDFTRQAQQLGWAPPANPGPFDLLPLIIQTPRQPPRWFQLPRDAVLEYTASPFSGWYMGTEIASRNLGDEARYNLLPIIADQLGLDRQSSWSLWKDRALVELNTAVLFSFSQAGVTMVDHHTASTQFMYHIDTEQSAGRSVPGDWTWLVPPMSSSACPVFHRSFNPAELMPNYLHQERAW
jgi:nitric-oxide synthase